jgi:hypothetical protein
LNELTHLDTIDLPRAQNQLDRLGTRRSNRIEKRNGQVPYGRGSGSEGGDAVAVGAAPGNPIAYNPHCPRGGTKNKKKKKGKKRAANLDDEDRWDVVDTPAPPGAALHARASETISNLSHGIVTNLANSSTLEWIQSMKALVAGHNWAEENGAFVSNSLQSLVHRCKRSLEMVVGVDFVTMVNMVQLAAKTDRWVTPSYYFCFLLTLVQYYAYEKVDFHRTGLHQIYLGHGSSPAAIYVPYVGSNGYQICFTGRCW